MTSDQQLKSDLSDSLLDAIGVEKVHGRECSFSFSAKQPPAEWKAFTFDLSVPLWLVLAQDSKLGEIRTFVSGIKSDNFLLLVEQGSRNVFFAKRAKKGDNSAAFFVIRNGDECERVCNVIRRLDFHSDELTAHSSISRAIDSLREGADRYFINRGLFSSYYLRERFLKKLAERGRAPQKEASQLYSLFGGDIPSSSVSAGEVLKALGYLVSRARTSGDHEQLKLSAGPGELDVGCIIAQSESLDTKTSNKPVPSYQAVALLRYYRWVILTNGRLWRLYSSRVLSSSTNYFEVDVDNVSKEDDPKLLYFISLFSASAFIPKGDGSDVDVAYDEGISYAKEIEEDLRTKIFDKQLFLNLIRAVLDYKAENSYTDTELETAKASSLKLLYRLMFILYAESRNLLPLENPNYREISMDSLRQKLRDFQSEPESINLWKCLKLLFSTISKGNPNAGVPEYDGALFEGDTTLDVLELKNKHLVEAMRDLTEAEGKGIDYQNLGVRHLGSLYEALLEYSVRQANRDLVVYRDQILDAAYTKDMKAKPVGYIEKGDLFLSVGGLGRKGSGSYFTPEEIVRFLVSNGLEEHLNSRREMFISDMRKLRDIKGADRELEKKTVDDLLGIKALDPAMGSGHFLVAAVDHITNWIIELLKENPDAPLQKEIETDRESIIKEQSGKGIKLNEELLTDSVILKRMVMKKCVYGVDLNPLAVELTKLSLWLDSFTIGTPLTFLDHHIRCGNSLIGLWLSSISNKDLNTTLDAWTDAGSSEVSLLNKTIIGTPDLTLEQVNRSRAAYLDVRNRTEPMRILLDMQVAGIIDDKLRKAMPRNLMLISKFHEVAPSKRPEWWDEVNKAVALAQEYNSFHWEFEFHDAFNKENNGFDLIIMNPPWDVVKPEDDDFFSVYEPKFRLIKSKQEKQKIIEPLLKNEATRKAYESYRNSIQQVVCFFKESGEYVRRGKGDTNLWKLFLERALRLLSKDGTISAVIPSGIVTDEGGKELRETLFDGRIKAMYEFENKDGIFRDVHRSYKFVLLVWAKSGHASSFPAAFYLHDVKALEGKVEQDKFLELSLELINKCAPDTLSIPEVRNEKQLEVFSKLYHNHPLLKDSGKGWTVALVSELHRTNDSDLFRTDGKGWPLIEGKNFHQFIPDFEKTIFNIDPGEGLERLSKHKELEGISGKLDESYLLVFRDVARSTDTKTMIACIFPPKSFCSNRAIVVIPRIGNNIPSAVDYSKLISYLAGLFNSFIFDFLIRTRITMIINFFYMYQTAVPSEIDSYVSNKIATISARLSSPDEKYVRFASMLEVKYGPLSMKDRVEMTAELNALVAKAYCLDRNELQTILDSFEGFEEDPELINMKEVKWSGRTIKAFNGEVRKRVLQYFDAAKTEGEST